MSVALLVVTDISLGESSIDGAIRLLTELRQCGAVDVTAEPADGVVLADGPDIWARRDDWLPVGMGIKTSQLQRWYSLDLGGGPYTWADARRLRAEQGRDGPLLRLVPERVAR